MQGLQSTLVQRFINSVTYSCSQLFGGRLRQFNLVEQIVQIVSGEFPFKRFCDLFVIKVETKNSFFERFQRSEVIGYRSLTLEDREIDFNLIQPTLMHRGMNEDEIG